MEKTHTHTVSRVAGALVASATLMPVASMAQELSFKEIANLEKQRLQLAVQNIDGQILEARKAYNEKDFQTSVDLYTQALATLPLGRVVDDRREHLTEALAQASVELSKTQVRNGDISGARESLSSVLKVDPENIKANEELNATFDPIRTNNALDIEHTVKVDTVRRHLYTGEGYYNSGQFDQALKEFDKVIRLDPYNTAARNWQTRVHTERAAYGRSAYDETRSRLLTEVDLAWEIVPAPLSSGLVDDRSAGDPVVGGNLIIQQRKLDNIMIPRIDLEGATLEAAIAELRQAARDNDPEPDPEKKGVTIVIRKRKNAGGADGQSIEDNEIRVGSLALQNVPLKEVLRQICLQCNPTMRYKVEEYSVVIVPASDGGETEVFSRQFNVAPDFVERLGGGAGPSGGGQAGIGDLFGAEEAENDEPASLKQLLMDSGVKFPDGASVRFIAASSSISVTNTAVGLDQIAKIIDDINSQVPKMIKITAKFVEINQQDTDELGFDWVISPFGLTANSLYLGGGSAGNGTTRAASDFSSSVNGNSVSGINSSSDVFNTATGGLRSGDTAITRDSIDSFLNNPTRTSQSSDVAPGILTLTGLFSESQVQMVMRGLAQKKGSDIMNAPSVLARPGETARIEVVRQFIYPTEYDPPELPDSIGGTNTTGDASSVTVVPITPATPTAFDVKPTGVILEVTPTVGDGTDSKTISLELTPEIVEFEGFINYGSPIQAIGTDALGSPVQITITENRIEQPVFSRRSIDTSLTIYDGHTVAIGGLMSEEVQKVEDKVPVLGDIPLLGRLFQSSSENRIKSNLVIFITANIIDPTGRPLYGSTVTAEAAAAVGGSSAGMISSDLLPPPSF